MGYVKNIDHPAKTVESRDEASITILVLHYTQVDFKESLRLLTETNVSVHYLVPEHAINDERTIYQLVMEADKARHAGVSDWHGPDVNKKSVGIEIVNLGYKDTPEGRIFIPYEDYQIATVIELARDIVTRHKIAPTNIVGHSDVAMPLGRKIDPGPLFPWEKLAQHGIGAWYDKDHVNSTQKNIIESSKTISITWLQANLKLYGYGVAQTDVLDEQTTKALQAFQMHFRPNDYTGKVDEKTCAILDSLIKRYFPNTYIPITEQLLENTDTNMLSKTPSFTC